MSEVIIPQKHPQKSGRTPFAVFILGIVLLIAIYFNIMVYWKNKSISEKSADIELLKSETISLITPEIEQIEETKQYITRLQQDTIQWSVLLAELLSVLPSDVSIASMTGEAKGKVTVNLLTSNMGTIARTIINLTTSDKFSNVFVPSLSTGISVDQNTVIHFPIVFEGKNLQTKEEEQGVNPKIEVNNNDNRSEPNINTNQV